MNTARKLIDEVESAGGVIQVDDGRLKLSAPEPLPDDLIQQLRDHKPEVIELLVGSQWGTADWLGFYNERAGILEFDHELSQAEAERRAFEWCVVEWLNQHPSPSEPDRCAWCGKPGDVGVVVPFGVEATWLHHDCWKPWHQQRRHEAVSALAEMGIGAK